jgi:Tfp pilus assembly protein PilN
MKRARLALDLIAAPRRLRWPGYLLLGLAIGTAAGLFQRHQHATLALQRLDSAADLVAVRQVAKAPRKALDEKSLQAALRQLALPWAGILQAAERAAGPDVAILQLQPEPQHKLLRISAEARNRDAMFKYLRSLSRAQGLSQVHLLSEEVQLEDPQKPIRFSAQASFGAMR